MNAKTLIYGNGPCAQQIAKELLSTGTKIIIACTDKTCEGPSSADGDFVEILTGVKILECRGTAGDFRLVAASNGRKIARTVANIIIAEEDRKTPNFSTYGLIPTPKVVHLSQLVEMLGDISFDRRHFLKAEKIVFLSGLAKESNPVIAEAIMRSCLKLQSDLKIRTYILTRNLKVAANGLEALYRETKKAGCVYVKFTDTIPDIDPQKDGGVEIEFEDEITLKKFRLTPDLTVVDEDIVPWDDAAELAEILRLDTDPAGFIQADNVHRNTVFTNRKGIMVAGPSRSIQSASEQATDAENVAIAVLGLMKSPPAEAGEKAVIDTGKCVRCLTCYRICPFRAINLNARVSVAPDACERCGICAAQCPANAIRINELEPENLSVRITAGYKTGAETAFSPLLVAFCCSRSAALAAKLASSSGHKLPAGLNVVEVPCAGSLSMAHIFTAFENNADGVLVLTCHLGNCHAERGNVYAQHTVDQITTFFQSIGFEKERLDVRTMASNMGIEFSEIVNRFEENILKLDSSRLKK